MKKISKTAIPSNLLKAACKRNLKKLIENRKQSQANPKLAKSGHGINWYRGLANDKNSPLHNLKIIYNNNCAYCERYGENYTVDHFRPKDSVAEDKTHSGYYWLGYEWSNLIYVCDDCNEKHKRTKFPISKTRVADLAFNNITEITDLIKLFKNLNSTEEPLLLNPEEDDFDPLDYIEIDRNGFCHPVKKNIRADKTIKDCGIDRPELNSERNSVMEEFVEKICLATFILWGDLKDVSNSKKAISRVLLILENDKPKEFSLLWKYMYLNFDDLIADKILAKKEHSDMSKILYEAFSETLENKLKTEPVRFNINDKLSRK